MKPRFFVVCAFVFALCGCATLSQGDRTILAQHNVSPALSGKMAHGEPLAVSDVIELSGKGLPAPFIIHYLRSTETSYPLTVDDVSRLKMAGVSPDVINYLLATPSVYGPPRGPYPPPFPYDPYYYSDTFGPYYHFHRW